jgi:multidrug resistance efflux pump
MARVKRLHGQGIIADQEVEDQAIAVRIAENDLETARRWRAASGNLQHAQEEQARLQIARSGADYRQQRDEYVVRRGQARARAEQAEQRVFAAWRLVDEAVIRATSPGVIVDLAVEVGDRTAAGTTLMAVAVLTELIVDVPIAARLINVLREGQEAVVALPTMPPQRVLGRVASINPIPSVNMTHTVEVRFANTSGRILSGQPAEVAFR